MTLRVDMRRPTELRAESVVTSDGRRGTGGVGREVETPLMVTVVVVVMVAAVVTEDG